MAEQVHLAEYLFTRLHQVGVRAIHGVPGDYNLTALDYVEPAGLDWVGNANELNAGYSADGYGRIKGVSALVTVIGVGELSAINAMAGSYAERSPVVYVVGTPATSAQNNGVCLHHTLGDGNYTVFAEMAAKVTVAQANLIDASTAAEEVDRTIRECVLQSRPVYIRLPTDMVTAKVSGSKLRRPINTRMPDYDEGFHDAEVEEILARIYASKQPFIIVDGFTRAYGITSEADELVRVTGFPTSTTPFGKGTVNETYSNFHGVYAGEAGKQQYRPWTEATDLVLRIAPLNSDVNTFGFSTVPSLSKSITFHRDSVQIGDPADPINSTVYTNLHIKSLLRHLLARLDPSRLPKYDPYPHHLGNPRELLDALSPTEPTANIDQDTFYQRISRFFNPHDIILTETGTLSVGSRDMILPPHSTLINSSLWLSIGYMLPAALGAALAQREQIADGTVPEGARTILFEGDGSLQMSVQAISDMIRNKVDITLFVLNNDGYTIERWIHGMKATYNDTPMWRYTDAAKFFGADLPANKAQDYPVNVAKAENWGELEKIMQDPTFKKGKGLNIVELFMDREDAPETLKLLVLGTAKRNRSAEDDEEEPKQKKSRIMEDGPQDAKDNEEAMDRMTTAAG